MKKNELKDKQVIKYIEQGEEEGYHVRRSMLNRRLWYDLGRRKPAPILLPYMIRQRARTIWNRADAYCPNVFHEASPFEVEHTSVLLGILNSTPSELAMELQGRLYGAGLLKIETYEWKKFPVLDPTKLKTKERKQIEQAFLALCESQRKNDKKAEEEAKKKLDDIVFNALGFNDSERKQVYEGLEYLRQMRLKRRRVEVLVETAEGWKPARKPKRKRKIVEEKPTKRLDTWMK